MDTPTTYPLTDVHNESGQTMAEYAVVLAVITIAVVVTLGLLSTAISGNSQASSGFSDRCSASEPGISSPTAASV